MHESPLKRERETYFEISQGCQKKLSFWWGERGFVKGENRGQVFPLNTKVGPLPA